jgi:hypothetical protein
LTQTASVHIITDVRAVAAVKYGCGGLAPGKPTSSVPLPPVAVCWVCTQQLSSTQLTAGFEKPTNECRDPGLEPSTGLNPSALATNQTEERGWVKAGANLTCRRYGSGTAADATSSKIGDTLRWWSLKVLRLPHEPGVRQPGLWRTMLCMARQPRPVGCCFTAKLRTVNLYGDIYSSIRGLGVPCSTETGGHTPSPHNGGSPLACNAASLRLPARTAQLQSSPQQMHN